MTRTELIHSLARDGIEQGEFLSKCLRGNTLWTLWKGEEHYVVAYQLHRTPEGWAYDRETEDTPPASFTCPRKYLDRAAVLHPKWRKELEKYQSKKKDIKAHIRALYKNKERGQILQVTITAKDGYVIKLHDYGLKDAVLYVVSVWPGIEGRFPQNGLRYKIPLRLVTDVRLKTNNHERDKIT